MSRTTTHPNGKSQGLPEKLPPNNREAEEALLGSILLDQGVFYEIADLNISAGDFYIHKNGWVFAAMAELHQAGLAVDLVTLEDKLASREQLEEIGDTAYLIALLNNTPTASHGPWYAQIVKSYAYRRRRIEAAVRLAQLAYDETIELDDLAEQSEEVWQSVQRFYTPRDSWKIRTLADAYKPRPPVCWIVKKLFALPSLSIVYGAPGSMKSLLMGDMLSCVTGGHPWLPALPGQAIEPREVMQAPVLWVDFDNGQKRTDERFEAFGRALNLPDTAGLNYVSMPSPWLEAADVLQVEALGRRVERLGAKVLVIDNLATILGGRNESNSEVIPVMSNLRRLAEAAGIAIILIHHERKKNGVKGRPGESLRGFGGIEAAVDLALQVERDGEQVTITSTKSRDVDVPLFAAQFTYEHKPGTVELSQARFFGVKVKMENDATGTLQAAILASVKLDPGLSQTKLRDKAIALTGIGRNRVRDEIIAMTEAGLLKAQSSSNGQAVAYYQGEIDF